MQIHFKRLITLSLRAFAIWKIKKKMKHLVSEKLKDLVKYFTEKHTVARASFWL